MKKVILFAAVCLMATAATAQQLTVAELLKQPALNSANVFTSDKQQIADDWGVGIENKDGKYIVDMSNTFAVGNFKTRDTYTYQGAKIKNVTLTINPGDNTRRVTMFLEGADKNEANKVAKKLKSDLKTIGIKMPALSGGLSRQFKKLPAPFTFIAINTMGEEMFIFSYQFTEGGQPDF